MQSARKVEVIFELCPRERHEIFFVNSLSYELHKRVDEFKKKKISNSKAWRLYPRNDSTIFQIHSNSQIVKLGEKESVESNKEFLTSLWTWHIKENIILNWKRLFRQTMNGKQPKDRENLDKRQNKNGTACKNGTYIPFLYVFSVF